MTCPECKSSDIVEGIISSGYPVTFIEKGTENKFLPKAHKITAKACKTCGKIFDAKIVLKKK